MQLLAQAGADHHWSSRGLEPREALGRWRSWACQALAPMQIVSADETRFSAHCRSHALGPISLVALQASAQRVVHDGAARVGDGSTFQLLYCSTSPIQTRVGAREFRLGVGQFVLLDNAQPYEMSMGEHEAVDLVMPAAWLERWLPDPHAVTAQPICAAARWGLPFGNLLQALASELEDAPVPRAMLADQVGALLALAVGERDGGPGPHKAALARRLVQLIEERHAEPELDPAAVAKAAGISKRYLHAVLAQAQTSFLQVLTRARLDQAGRMLADRRFRALAIGEVAWRCGYPDASYFARLFRRRHGMGPRQWRAAQLD